MTEFRHTSVPTIFSNNSLDSQKMVEMVIDVTLDHFPKKKCVNTKITKEG